MITDKKSSVLNLFYSYIIQTFAIVLLLSGYGCHKTKHYLPTDQVAVSSIRNCT